VPVPLLPVVADEFEDCEPELELAALLSVDELLLSEPVTTSLEPVEVAVLRAVVDDDLPA
jgi:hypothetical protein